MRETASDKAVKILLKSEADLFTLCQRLRDENNLLQDALEASETLRSHMTMPRQYWDGSADTSEIENALTRWRKAKAALKDSP